MQSARSSIHSCSLYQQPIEHLLHKLNNEASHQIIKMIPVGISLFLDMILRRKPTIGKHANRMKNLYIPISPEQGSLLYILARSISAKYAVEFGTSFGISTIYLGAAIKDGGSGKVLGTEIEPDKVKIARNNIRNAGLADYVEIAEGDAQITLKGIKNNIDMVFLDGWKDLYLPIIKLLQPSMRSGGVVVADNIYSFKRALAPYVEYMNNPENGFASISIPYKSGMLLSCKIQAAQ